MEAKLKIGQVTHPLLQWYGNYPDWMDIH